MLGCVDDPRTWSKRGYRRFEGGVLLILVAALTLTRFESVPFVIRFTVMFAAFVLMIVTAFVVSIPWYRERIRQEREAKSGQ